MNFSIEYLNYEGDVKKVLIENVDSKEEAIEAAYNDECNYSGDNIYKIIDIMEE